MIRNNNVTPQADSAINNAPIDDESSGPSTSSAKSNLHRRAKEANLQQVEEADTAQIDDLEDRDAQQKNHSQKKTKYFGKSLTFWRGIGALLAGMMIQAALGVVSIWGNIVIYETSKLRADDTGLSLQFALIVFPTTLAVGSVAMQFGSYLMDVISPRQQLVLGGTIYATSVFLGQYATNFTVFLIVYAVLVGIGFGIIYFLPLVCAWSYFPGQRNLVAGIIMSCFSVSAIFCSRMSTSIINPDNARPDIIVSFGKTKEIFYSPESPQVQNLPLMHTRLSQVAIVLLCMAVVLISKKEEKTTVQTSRKSIKCLEESVISHQNGNHKEVERVDPTQWLESVGAFEAVSVDAPEKNVSTTGSVGIGSNDSVNDFRRGLSDVVVQRDTGSKEDCPPQSHALRRAGSFIAQDQMDSLSSIEKSIKRTMVSDHGITVHTDLSSMTVKQTLEDRTFWHIGMMLTASLTYGFFMKVAFKSYGTTNFSDDQYLTFVATMGFMTAAISRFFWAGLQEVIGFRKVYFIILSIQIFLAFTMTLFSADRQMYCLYVCLSWSCEGGHFSIFPPLAGQVYGPCLGIKINALFFIGFSMASLIGVLLNNTIVPLFGWTAIFWILGSMSIASMCMLFYFSMERTTFIPFIRKEEEAAIKRRTSQTNENFV